MLIEAARKMAVEVEVKVANANLFAEQVRKRLRGRACGRGKGASLLPGCRPCERQQQPLASSAVLAALPPSPWPVHPPPIPICPQLPLPTVPLICQVGVEKEKVAAENAAAQVEADKCAEIAREVSEKQSSCERDLAAAEPLVAQVGQGRGAGVGCKGCCILCLCSGVVQGNILVSGLELAVGEAGVACVS